MRNLRNIYFFEHFAEIIPLYLGKKVKNELDIIGAMVKTQMFSNCAYYIEHFFWLSPPKSSVLSHQKRIKKSIFSQIAPLLSSSFLTFVPKSSLFLHKKCKKKKSYIFLKNLAKKRYVLKTWSSSSYTQVFITWKIKSRYYRINYSRNWG